MFFGLFILRNYGYNMQISICFMDTDRCIAFSLQLILSSHIQQISKYFFSCCAKTLANCEPRIAVVQFIPNREFYVPLDLYFFS